MPYTFTVNVTKEAFDAKKAAVGAANGPDVGTLSYSGVTIGYSFNAAAGMVTVQIQSKPWIVSNQYVENRIREWLSA